MHANINACVHKQMQQSFFRSNTIKKEKKFIFVVLFVSFF